MTQSANMMLRIDTQEGGAIKALLGVERQMGKLGEATRVAAVAAKANATEEAKAGKAVEGRGAAVAKTAKAVATLEASTRAEVVATKLDTTTTTTNTGTMKTAAQARLELMEARKKATREQKIALEFTKLEGRAQAQLAKDDRERAARHAEQAQAAGKARKETSGWATALGKVAAAGAVAGVALDEMAAAHTRAMEAAKRSDAAGAGLMGFAALQAPGEEGQAHVRRTVIAGGRAGLKTDATGTIAQAIQSIADADGNRKLEGAEKTSFDDSFGAALKLGQLGVKPEDIQNAITAAMVRGESGSMEADKTVLAAGASKLDEGDFAASAAAMQQWQDSDAAKAAVAAMSRTEAKGELPTLTRAAAQALGQAGDSSEFSAKFGLAGLSEADKIAKLREVGAREGTGATAEERVASFSRTLTDKGLDETKARAVGALLREGASFEQTLGSLRDLKPGGDLVGARLSELKKDPVIASLMQSREAAAMQEVNDLYGESAGAARDERAQALSRGAELTAYGGGRAVDPTTGEEKGVGFSANPLEAFGLFSQTNRDIIGGRLAAMWNGMPGTGFNGTGVNQDRDKTGGERLELTLNKLAESLDRNTKATEANSTSARASRPAPAPVEGEKY